MEKTIEYYQDKLDDLAPKCKFCSEELDDVILYYSHEGGRHITGMDQKQWLYTECPKCDYQWALHKLRISYMA